MIGDFTDIKFSKKYTSFTGLLIKYVFNYVGMMSIHFSALAETFFSRKFFDMQTNAQISTNCITINQLLYDWMMMIMK